MARPPYPDGSAPRDRPADGSDRWQRIDDVFHEALALPPEARPRFVEHACGDDPGLIAEVASLLHAEARGSGETFERWAAGAAAVWVRHASSEGLLGASGTAPVSADAGATALIGRRLGHYDVLSRLGAGGMGEVYLARDTKLHRLVALKVLPDGLAHHPDRLRRFFQEARAASSLAHPHVAAIHELAEADGVHFIVMEYVQGRTLAALIRESPPSIDESLRIVTDIAAALEEAHRAGITHRDIKPANVMITDRGVVKVLDFGLAKRMADADEGRESLATTRPGLVLGTIHYMSPEQALAGAVDHRSDLFSLGVVMYELLTGRLPFDGPSATASLDALLHSDPPPVSGAKAGMPKAFDRVLGRALAKAPGQRYQHARELADDVAALRQGREPRGARRSLLALVRSRTSAVALTVALAAAVVGGLVLWPSRLPPAPTLVPFTTFAGNESTPAISPDGTVVVYAWDGADGRNVDLYVHRIGEGEPVRLTIDPAVDSYPAFSPDGALVAFARARSRLIVVPVGGGKERDLGPIDDPRISFTPDGAAVVAGASATPGPQGAGIVAIPLDGSGRRMLTQPGAGSTDIAPVFSPDGTRLAFQRIPTISVADIYVANADGTGARRLTFDERQIEGPTWTADGHALVFASGRLGAGRLWRVPASGGEPEPVPETGPGSTTPSVARAGNRLVFNQTFEDTNTWQLRLDATGRPSGPAERSPGSSTWLDGSPDIAADGQSLVFASNRTGRDEIWIGSVDGVTSRQLTNFAGVPASAVGSPRWSPDGKRVVFDARIRGNADVYVVDAAGGEPRRITTDPSTDVVPSWSRDGRWIYFTSRRTGRPEVWRVAAGGGDERQITVDGGFGAQESLDGNYIVYGKDRVRSPLWRRRVGGGPEEPMLLTADGTRHSVLQFAYWRPTRTGVVFLEERPGTAQRPAAFDLCAFDADTGRVTCIASLGNRPSLSAGGLALSPDGTRLLFTQLDQQGSDIMLLQNFR